MDFLRFLRRVFGPGGWLLISVYGLYALARTDIAPKSLEKNLPQLRQVAGFGPWWGVALVGALLLVALTLIGTYRVVRLEASPPTRVVKHPDDPHLYDKTWFMRLDVWNDWERDATYYAKIESIQGSTKDGPTPAWWVIWRHNGVKRDCSVPGGSREILHLARAFQKNGSVEFCFEVAQTEQDTAAPCHVAPRATDSEILQVELKVWHRESGRLVAHKKVLLGVQEIDGGALEPTYEMVDAPN